jgi:hypothetical protein
MKTNTIFRQYFFLKQDIRSPAQLNFCKHYLTFIIPSVEETSRGNRFLLRMYSNYCLYSGFRQRYDRVHTTLSRLLTNRLYL